jgi:hypothetical protein
MEHPPALTEEERVNRLVVRLARSVGRGGRIETQSRFGAIVLERTRARVGHNLVMVVAGLILFGMTMEPLFALAALLSAFGWHRKIISAANPRRLWIRVDETGSLSETELESAPA